MKVISMWSPSGKITVLGHLSFKLFLVLEGEFICIGNMEEIVLSEILAMLSRTSLSALLANKTMEEVSQLLGRLHINLPTSLKNVIFQADNPTPGSPRSGCNDAFSVFAFFSFLLALIQLIQNAEEKIIRVFSPAGSQR